MGDAATFVTLSAWRPWTNAPPPEGRLSQRQNSPLGIVGPQRAVGFERQTSFGRHRCPCRFTCRGTLFTCTRRYLSSEGEVKANIDRRLGTGDGGLGWESRAEVDGRSGATERRRKGDMGTGSRGTEGQGGGQVMESADKGASVQRKGAVSHQRSAFSLGRWDS